jgi:hypothetical protein
MSAHTPGPWAYTRDGEHWRIEKPDGITAMAGSCKPEFQKLTTFPTYIGTIHGTTFNVYNSEGRDKPDIGEANARLIAAAPELLEALKMARDYIRRMEGSLNLSSCGEYQAARDAIAKAEQEVSPCDESTRST